MWKMQLLDESHILIKYASEDVVTLKATEPNSQPSFFMVYNMVDAEVFLFAYQSNVLLSSFKMFNYNNTISFRW